jgi:alginate O-acetyltransferase complex protein AlgI
VVFSSAAFLFCFLPIFLTAYFVVPIRLRNATALAGSLWFYAWGAPLFVYVLLASTLLDYVISRMIAASESTRRRRHWLIVSLVANLGLLLYFKYANFFVDQVDWFLQTLGHGTLTWEKVALPIGISFFTFQKISYVVDVFRGSAHVSRSYADCLLYVVLFPQLIAGPIVRYHDVDQQIRARVHDPQKFWSGVQRFTLGLAKKALIANQMAAICDEIHSLPDQVSTGFAWLAAIAYYFQIYFDFSGYSDMAIGLGRMVGFEFLENFQRPYTATNFTDFWRRWHISLSNFMREYVYIPLGGNRVGPVRGYVNLWVVFLVSGFWHGASWTFVVWGAYQGLFLTLDKMGWLRIQQRLPKPLLRLLMLFLVLISWVIFRSETLARAGDMLWLMAGQGGPAWYETLLASRVPLDAQTWGMLGIAAMATFVPCSAGYASLEQRFLAWGRTTSGTPVLVAVTLVGLVVSCMAVVNSSHNPFIYFRF